MLFRITALGKLFLFHNEELLLSRYLIEEIGF